MPNFNSVTLMGNITRDIELRHTPSGTAVCEFGIAINERWSDKSGEKQERTTFVDCTAWAKTAEIIGEHLSKGKPIFICGKLQTDQWEDKTSGQKRSKLKVVVDKFEFVGGDRKQGGGSQGQYQSESGEGSQETTGGDQPPQDEVPF